MFLLHPPRLKKALEVLDTDSSGEVDVDEWETAINRGLAKRLEQMAKERERRERAAAAADEEFSAEFLTAARKVFQMIDDDDSGTLEKAEIVRAVRANKEVIKFLTDCGNKNLQHLLVPSRLESALAQMDTDHDGTIDADEWCVLESATLGRLSTSPAHRLMFRAGRSASRRRSRTSLSSAPRPARRRARQRSRRSPSSLGSSFPPPSAASSSSTRTVAGRSALDCVEIKSQASHAMDATILLRITQLTGRCPHRHRRDRFRHKERRRSGKVYQQLRRRKPDVPAPPAAPQEGPVLPRHGPERRDRQGGVARHAASSTCFPVVRGATLRLSPSTPSTPCRRGEA